MKLHKLHYLLLLGIYLTNKPNETISELFQKATLAIAEEKFDEGISYYEEIISQNPNLPEVWYNKGVILFKQKKYEESAQACERAISLRPNYAKGYFHLGKAYEELGKFNQAQEAYEKALKFDNSIEFLLAIARLYVKKEEPLNAIPYFKKAHALKPFDSQIIFEFANACNTANETTTALTLYYELLKKNPASPSVLYNVGYTLKKIGKVEEALVFYNRVLDLNPEHNEARFSRGLAYLFIGNFIEGWKDYEFRFKRDGKKIEKFTKHPQWDGTNLSGKSILLFAEQGLGDTFQFIRYALLVKTQYNPRKLIVAVQSPLIRIISHCCPYIDQVIGITDPLPVFDVQAPLMSLPFILKTEKDSIPASVPYLFADESLINFWKTRLSHDKNFKVGICFQGNNKYSTPFLRTVVAQKSISIDKFKPLSTVPGVSFYSLQKETGVEQLKNLPFELITFDDDFDKKHGRFMDTAALLMNLDLIITIDTSIAHFAAALGVKHVWVFIPNPPDWRWMFDSVDTPWYPNMRLFRQSIPGDWESVMLTIRDELYAFVHGKQYPELKKLDESVIEFKSLSLPEEELYKLIEKNIRKLTTKKPINQLAYDIHHLAYLIETYKTLKELAEPTIG